MSNMAERIRVKSAVFLILEREGKYLFSQRKNTGYRDGFYSLPSGHVDVGEMPTEAVVREAKEEIGINCREEDLVCVHAMFERDNYADYYFMLRSYEGEPENLESEKCSEIYWGTLPEFEGKMVEKVERALRAFEGGVMFSQIEKTD